MPVAFQVPSIFTPASRLGIIAEITPQAAERIEFYGRRLKVGDRITHCPDLVCGQCYTCKHVMGYVWCDNSSATATP